MTSARLSVECPHCHHAIVVRLGAVEPLPNVAAAIGPAAPPPAPSAQGAICGCGHERGWHNDKTGACMYGAAGPHGGCPCIRYHSPRSKAEANYGEPGEADVRSVAARKCERAILACLRAEVRPVTRERLGLRCLYVHSGGGFGNALGALRTADLVDDVEGGLILSDRGAKVAAPDTVLDGLEAVRAWRDSGKFGKCEREILDVLLAQPAASLSRQEIAARTASGYAGDAGGFGNALGALRSVGVLVGCVLNPAFFLGGGR